MSRLKMSQKCEDNEASEREESQEKWRDEVFVIQDVRNTGYGVERPEKQITTKRKQVLEGVYPPRLKDLVANKENRRGFNPETAYHRSYSACNMGPGSAWVRAKESRTRERKCRQGTGTLRKKEKGWSQWRVDEPRFDGNRDDDIIEDRSKKLVEGDRPGTRD
jgi:hypothetical protein